MPSINYIHRRERRGGGQVSNTLLMRITCYIGVGGLGIIQNLYIITS